MQQQQPEPGFQPQLSWLGQTLDKLSARVNGTGRQLGQLTERLAATEAHVRDLTATVNALDRRFTEVLNQAYERDHPDALDSTFLAHQQLAEELAVLLGNIWQVIHDEMKRTEPEARAHVMAYTTHMLWQRLSPEQRDMGLPRKHQTVALTCIDAFGPEVARLVGRVRALTDRDVFDFANRLRRLDPHYQKPWAECDPDGAVKYVVTPGYVVDNRVVLPQQVFTSPNDGM